MFVSKKDKDKYHVKLVEKRVSELEQLFVNNKLDDNRLHILETKIKSHSDFILTNESEVKEVSEKIQTNEALIDLLESYDNFVESVDNSSDEIDNIINEVSENILETVEILEETSGIEKVDVILEEYIEDVREEIEESGKILETDNDLDFAKDLDNSLYDFNLLIDVTEDVEEETGEEKEEIIKTLIKSKREIRAKNRDQIIKSLKVEENKTIDDENNMNLEEDHDSEVLEIEVLDKVL